ncbi:MAG: siphovirus Gp157 family protein [Rhodothermales bacterium]|nr:siphovirus Gp157 family protein [Rhodothermales bacterium]
MESPKPLALYEIDRELHELESALIEAGGEITEEVDERFNDLLQMRAEKVAGYVAVIRRLETSADAYASEAQRLSSNARAMQNSADRLKQRLLEAMLARGDQEYDTPLGRIRTYEGSSRSVTVLVDPEDLPDRFKRVTVVPDKRALADALKSLDPDAVRLAEFEPPTPFLRIL